jgi:hypothetical protein
MIDGTSVSGPRAAAARTDRVFQLGAEKVRLLAAREKPGEGSPVFTAAGKYTSRGWTEWTQGFRYGSALLVFEVSKDPWFLSYGRDKTLSDMAVHLSHIGVHDHGFNNMSTYGNLLRLMREGLIEDNPWEKNFYELALKMSGAVQAARWTDLPEDLGFIYSFNGPHSLFADTIRSLRVLAAAHGLDHVLMGERDRKISLLGRLLRHGETTARYIVYFGKGRDRWDVSGRVAHEAVFNLNDGSFRCPSSQQGYSPFTTWTRGLAWILLGYAEELDFLSSREEREFSELRLPYFSRKEEAVGRFLEVARATADFYIANTPTDGVPYWDTGAPNLHRLGDYLNKPADPYNAWEPVDSSAAAIAAQGFLRLGAFLEARSPGSGSAYIKAGLKTAETLMGAPYLCDDPWHEGLLLHAVYHNPNGWDYMPPGRMVPSGESCLWGDYHLLELALYIRRMI